jgi:hypothetical protein
MWPGTWRGQREGVEISHAEMTSLLRLITHPRSRTFCFRRNARILCKERKKKKKKTLPRPIRGISVNIRRLFQGWRSALTHLSHAVHDHLPDALCRQCEAWAGPTLTMVLCMQFGGRGGVCCDVKGRTSLSRRRTACFWLGLTKQNPSYFYSFCC